jgi:hypothetical protein
MHLVGSFYEIYMYDVWIHERQGFLSVIYVTDLLVFSFCDTLSEATRIQILNNVVIQFCTGQP